jgi:flagellar hook-associated protein 3 FlgL
MRITESLNQNQFLSSIGALESSISQTQNEISSNSSFTEPSQNPVAAGEVNDFSQTLAQSQQFQTNANSAKTNLSTESNALSSVQTTLQSLRDLALEATSGTESSSNLSAIATQATQIQNSLLSLANTQNGNGEYIFGGYATQTQPFTLTSTGATYNGNTGQRQIQIAVGQTVADGDNGDAVFNQIPTGNGTFTVTAGTAGAANTGSGIIGATTVSDAAAYTGQPFKIVFTSPTAYNIENTAGAVQTTGTYTSGDTIAYEGTQVTLTGTPNATDTFNVAPSTKQSLFTTVQNLVTALNQGVSGTNAQVTLSNSVSAAINNIDQALNQASNVQASVGGRLNTITTQLSVAGSTQTQLQKSIASLQGLNYAAAITTLDQQNTTLSAALQAYTVTQGLTLFKYLS